MGLSPRNLWDMKKFYLGFIDAVEPLKKLELGRRFLKKITTQNPLQPLSLHSQYIAATFTAHRRSVQNTSYEFISMIINYLHINHTNYSSPCREKSLPTCSLHASLHG